MSILVRYWVCCDLLLLSTITRLVHETTITSIFGGVRCHCLPAMFAHFATHCTQYSDAIVVLSTVHSKQQECTPDRQECTIDSEASEA